MHTGGIFFVIFPKYRPSEVLIKMEG